MSSELTPPKPAAKQVSWEELERQDWHLWILAVLLIMVMGVSLLSFMLPSVFWFHDQFAIRAPQRAFLGFCVLLGLALLYMMQRQRAMRRLKRQLYEALAAASAAERQSAVEMFHALPDVEQFRNTLAMDFRRAASAGASLSVVVLGSQNPAVEAMGQAANTLRYMLRKGETLFRVAENRFGIILPGMSLAEAGQFAEMAVERLRQQLNDPRVGVIVTNYPEEAEGVTELEGRLHLRAPQMPTHAQPA